MLFKDQVYQFTPATVPNTAKTVIQDLPYATGSRHTLDIYLPSGAQPFPVILDLYGGGLLRGKKSSFKLNPSLRFLTDQFAVISMDYRLNVPPYCEFPNQIAEIRAALDFLTRNATMYNLDMQHVILIGESSGAQLAMLAAASFAANVTLGHIPNHRFLDQFPKVAGVIGLYGPYQVDQFATQFNQLHIIPKFLETGSAIAFEGIMLQGNRPDSVPSLVKQANPATYFTPSTPPTLLIAGTKDHVVPYLQSLKLAEDYYRLVGKKPTTLIIPNADHGPSDYNTSAIYYEKLAFINEHIKAV